MFANSITISSLICNYTDPRQCADLKGVFNYVNNWYNSDAGVVGSSWWARGESFVSGEQSYYAFCTECAQCLDEMRHEMKKTLICDVIS